MNQICIILGNSKNYLEQINFLSIVFIPCNGAYIKGSGGKDTLFYTTDDKQKGYMGTPVKNILIALLIETSSNLKEKVMRIK